MSTQPTSVLCVGDIVLDQYEDGTTFVGGVALNVALGCVDAGWSTGLIASIGEDFAIPIEHHLSGIKHLTPHLEVNAGQTARIQVLRDNGERRFGPLQPGVMDALSEARLVNALMRFNGLVFVPALRGLSSIATRCAELVPNDRVAVSLSHHSIPCPCFGALPESLEQLSRLAAQHASIVIVGSTAEAREWLLRLSNEYRGCLIVLTAGEYGVWIFRAGEVVAFSKSLMTNRIDTNGCGDAYTAAFLTSLLSGAPPSEALQRGIAAADRALEIVGPNRLPPFQIPTERRSLR
jgi:sugar/nucleoside kinase (ribokinase family)